MSQIFGIRRVSFFQIVKKTVFKGCFFFFLTKEHPILAALKQMILYEIKQSNGIKPQEIYFFMIFCQFLPHKGNFCWKVPSKVIYTFYLKLQKYPFCAPIFHHLSELSRTLSPSAVRETNKKRLILTCQPGTFVSIKQTWCSTRTVLRPQMEQQKEILPGGHRLLSEYFQSYDRKRRYDEATDELLCSNLLLRLSGQAGDEYHGNPPNIMVSRQIYAK